MKLIKNAKKNFFIASDNLLNEYIGEEEINKNRTNFHLKIINHL